METEKKKINYIKIFLSRFHEGDKNVLLKQTKNYQFVKYGQ